MYLIVGCGLSGATIAERIANVLNEKVIIIDKRPHIGGNCYDYIERNTNIRINKYGAHLFHTNNKKIWEDTMYLYLFKNICVFVLGIIIVFSNAVAGVEAPANIKSKGKIVFCTELAYPPWK